MALKLRKSAGVRVTRRVYEKISAGDAARNRGDMLTAIASYRGALNSDPSLSHIWVQLGHMLKDSGSDEEAILAYERALSEGVRDRADAILHIAHLEKDRGRTAQAARYFLRAAQLDPAATAPLRGLAELLSRARGGSDVALGDIWRSLAGLSLTEPIQKVALPARATASMIVADCTSLIRVLADASLSRTAARQHCEMIDAAHADVPDRLRLAHVHPDTGNWVELLNEEYHSIRTALSRDDAYERADVANHILLVSAMRVSFEFPKGSWILGLGLAGDAADHPLAEVAARNRYGVRYAAIVNDLLPLALPQFSPEGRHSDLIGWLFGLFNAADLILAGSREIAHDLVRLADDAGIDVADRIATVRLSAPSVPVGKVLAAGDEAGAAYVVVVGNISGAKGHLIALDAWLDLCRQYGEELPSLILLGDASSDDSTAIVRRVRSDPLLSRKVRFAGDVTGEALALLYDGAALVLCPALYEGSDAVLADARARRATIIASDLPALREHGGTTLFVPPGDMAALKAAIRCQLFGAGRERPTEAEGDGTPTGGFGNVVAELDRNAGTLAQRGPQQAIPGCWHSFASLSAREIRPVLGKGADFRSDNGWLAPGAAGCWTRPGGGEIRIGLPAEGRWRLSLWLAGLPAKGTRWTLHIEGRDTLSGSLDAGARTWVVVDDLVIPRGFARLFLEGRAYDVVDDDRNGRGRKRIASIGVVGFHVCPQDDWAARERFLETLALSDLSVLSAYA